MGEVRKTYSNGDITVVWQPALCMHSRKCFEGLPAVFDPARRPWIAIQAAPTATIVAQVEACPSGALSLLAPAEAAATPAPAQATRIELSANGPLLVSGDVVLVAADGREQRCAGRTALCRCGASRNKPFCDGSHKAAGFEG